MAFRYLEHVDIDGRQITMYITQVFFEESLRCFKVEVHDTDKFDFLLCKNDSNEWKIVTQIFPELIIARLFDPLVSKLDIRMQQESTYLSPN